MRKPNGVPMPHPVVCLVVAGLIGMGLWVFPFHL
jgi:hypothetical protein